MPGKIDLTQFAVHRLGGQEIPADLHILLDHAAQFTELTAIEFSDDPDWRPWSDTSYLSEEQLADPDIRANTLAIDEVCKLIAIVAATEDSEYYGYWRGPTMRNLADSPLLRIDTEFNFMFCPGSNLVEALMADVFNTEQFTTLKSWLASVGIVITQDCNDDIAFIELTDTNQPATPETLHDEFYARFLEADKA